MIRSLRGRGEPDAVASGPGGEEVVGRLASPVGAVPGLRPDPGRDVDRIPSTVDRALEATA